VLCCIRSGLGGAFILADEITPIEINDKAFLIASTIERCPKVMMLRELMMNAFEAAAIAPAGQRRVEISAKLFHSVPKLTIWNTGPGMDSTELHEMCDLASSIGKRKGLDANFGMGAKVASLPSNRLGMRYRSCKNGTVSEVILCERSGVYGRLRRRCPDGSYAEVIDVTAAAIQEGYELSADWTEVTLLGSDPKQNTVYDPYDGDPKCDSQWIATYLYHRFYKLPAGVRIFLHAGTHRLENGRSFFTIPERIAAGAFDKAETVLDERSGIKIHYIYDGPYDKYPSQNKSHSGALQSSVSTCAVVHKGEMYDVRKGRAWTLDAPIFGIAFGARHFSTHIELPDDYAVRPDGYRQFLRYTKGEQEQVFATDFAMLVAQNRPQWLIELIRQFAPDSPSQDDIRKELQALLDHLRVHRSSPRVAANGATFVEPREGPAIGYMREGDGPGDHSKGREIHIDLTVAPTGAKRADIWKNRERAPVIIPLRTIEEIEEKQIRERAGRYYDNGQLFINMLYPSVQQMKEQLEKEYADAPDIEQIRSAALQLAEQTIMILVGRAVVYALAKQTNKDWNSEAIKVALSPESLSLAADDYHDALQSARRKIGIKFRLAGRPADVTKRDVVLNA
jgi:hypothetical protein